MSRNLLLIGLVLVMTLSVKQLYAIEVVDAVVTTAIVDREPVDMVDVFPIKSGRLYCYSRITGAEESTVVYHAWFHNKELMMRAELPVNSSYWRTWSARTFLEDQPGPWRVEIQDVDGNILQKVDFLLRG